MTREASNEQTGNFLTVAIASGLLAGVALIITLGIFGVSDLECVVLAALGGFTLGAFVYRERALTHMNELMRKEQNDELARLEKRIQNYYDHSLACLAYFNASTLMVEKVSAGFLQLLRIPSEVTASGNSIAELLRVSPSRMEAIISELRRGQTTTSTHELMAEDARGRELLIEVTMEFFMDNNMVEASFFVSPVRAKEDFQENDIARKDLDRFRRGMYRRETRILELKDEVNEVLEAAGREPRYRFERKIRETQTPIEEISENGEGF